MTNEPSMTMIERVARAITHEGEDWHQQAGRAVLAIKAMVGPSFEMRMTGRNAYLAARNPMDDFSVGCGVIFDAMIGAALDDE
jgi:hypothetical protein